MSDVDVSAGRRWAWAEIDAEAIEHNVATVCSVVSPAAVWAVVKANGYGHEAVGAAQAAQRGGAAGLCVALVDEGLQLRSAGVAGPVLVFGEQPPAQLPAAVSAGLTMTVASRAGIDAVAAASGDAPTGVHLKVDTGMHRVGVDATDAVALARLVLSADLRLEGVYTHLAVADVPDHPFTAQQLDRFDEVLADLRAAGIDPGLVHTANSAGALAHPRARHDLVRVGIATYGISPGAGIDQAAASLQPALSLHARVSAVRRVAAGERISYGLRHQFARDATVAAVPIGYADGVPRRSFECGVEVLIGGRRRPIVGVVTMDQLMVDVGDDEVSVGDGVVLIGNQGDECVTATEWALRLGTIGYEIVTGISAGAPCVAVANG